jgi:hypothetical protein
VLLAKMLGDTSEYAEGEPISVTALQNRKEIQKVTEGAPLFGAYMQFNKTIPDRVREWNRAHGTIKKHFIMADIQSKIKGYMDLMFIDVDTGNGVLFCERFINLKHFKAHDIARRKSDHGTQPYRLVTITCKRQELPELYSVVSLVNRMIYENGWTEAFDYQMEFLS